MNSKKCIKCGCDKLLSEFYLKKSSKDGHTNTCKLCAKEYDESRRNSKEYQIKKKEYDKKRYHENREENLERSKKFHYDHQEEILAKKKIYRKNNEDKIKQWRDNNKILNSQGQIRYRKNNPHIIAWRSLVYRTLKYFGTIKESHTIDILGYSAEELKLHIEKQFAEGMSWGNYGEWEIDHIRPLCTFDYTTHPSIVNALSNLRPLWEEENLTRPKFLY